MKRVVLLFLVVAACKSSQGERCQVDADCDSNLVCNKAKNTCQTSGNADEIDGSVPDAPPGDASVADAPPDSD